MGCARYMIEVGDCCQVQSAAALKGLQCWITASTSFTGAIRWSDHDADWLNQEKQAASKYLYLVVQQDILTELLEETQHWGEATPFVFLMFLHQFAQLIPFHTRINACHASDLELRHQVLG